MRIENSLNMVSIGHVFTCSNLSRDWHSTCNFSMQKMKIQVNLIINQQTI